MMEDLEVAGKHSEGLAMINDQINRLNHTVTQLLSFSRPVRRAEERSGRAESTHLQDLLYSTAAVAGNSASNAERCRFEISTPRELPPLMAEASLLHEIFLNLFLNAIQAGSGSCRVRVTESGKNSGETGHPVILLEIEDDGPGVPAAVQPHIFEAFYTTRQRGTGLGLYIVKRNIEALGGTIVLRSPLGDHGGSLFRISIPLQQA
jgi:two-component system sensor histidine kinase HydH